VCVCVCVCERERERERERESVCVCVWSTFLERAREETRSVQGARGEKRGKQQP
jgi:hypothetical protein